MTFDFSAVLFDLDGVILDSMQQHARLWQEIMAGEGIAADLDFILEHEGCLGPEVLDKLAAGRGRAQGLEGGQVMARLLERHRAAYHARHAGQVRTFPGVRRLLRGLAASGRPAALVTSSWRAVVEESLPAEVLAGFTVVITSDDVRRHKPDPEPYLTAAAALGVAPGRCLVVENAPAGIAAANAAGAVCVAISSTLPPAKLAQARAVYPSLLDLAAGLGLAG